MPDWLELVTLNLPGRQARFGQPLRTELGPLTTELAEYWAGRKAPRVFFGYCSGAVLAYSVARALHERGAALPGRLVVGSYKAPHLVAGSPLAGLDPETFWEALVANQAVPPGLAAHDELRKLSEPVLRADLALAAGYGQTSPRPLPIPITVLVGDRDSWLAADDVAAWAQYTTECAEVRHLPAGHWFMEEDPAAAVAVLTAEAAAAGPG